MILAAPLVIPFSKAVPALAGLTGILGMTALSEKVNEYIQENPEESMKILSTIIPGAGIGQIFMSKEDKISLEDLDEMTDEEAQDLSKEEKAELMKQAGKSGGKNKRQTMIDISEKLGLSGSGKEKQDIEYDIDERYDEGGVEEVSKPKFDYTKFFRKRRADGGAIGIEVLFEEKKDGGRAGSTMKSKRGLVDEPGGYAGLTEQQEALLGLQLQNDPEYQTGFYKSSPELKFEDFYKAPVGPLRYVDEVQGSDSYFDEDLEKYNIGPAGPLRNLDPARTQGILETLDFNDPSGELAFNYIDRLKSTEDGGFYETIQTNKPKFSEFQLIPEDQIKITPPKNFQNLSSTPKKGVYGYTTLGMPPSEYGTTFMNQTNPIYLNENLAKYITTKPMSPANQKLIFDTGVTGMYAAKPADLMSKAIDTVQHEYAHNITKFPAFANVMKNAMNAPTPKDFQLKGKPGDDLSKYDKEELFTRALDIERLFRKEGDLNNPSIDLDLDYMNSILGKKYKNLNNQGQSLAIQYINSLRPQVKDYFDTVDRLNVLGRDKDRGGFDPSGPTQASIRATREDRSGRGQRGGFTNPGKGSYGPFMANGGRVGFDLGGLTGPAKSIYDSMMAAGYFTEDEIRNAIIGAGYEIPGASQPEQVTGIINQQLQTGGGDGPKGDFGIFGNLDKSTAKDFNVEVYDEELGDFVPTTITGYKNVNSGLYQDKFGKNLQPAFSNKGQAFGLFGLAAQALGLTPDTVGGYVPGSIKGKYDGIGDMFGNIKNPFNIFKKQQATLADIQAMNKKAVDDLNAKLAAEKAAKEAAIAAEMARYNITSDSDFGGGVPGGGGGNVRTSGGDVYGGAAYGYNEAEEKTDYYKDGGLASMFVEKR